MNQLQRFNRLLDTHKVDFSDGGTSFPTHTSRDLRVIYVKNFVELITFNKYKLLIQKQYKDHVLFV